jgi:hypothetical protein
MIAPRFTKPQKNVEQGRPRKYLRIFENGGTWSINNLALADGSTYIQAKQAVWALTNRGLIDTVKEGHKYSSALYLISEAGLREIADADRVVQKAMKEVVGETMVHRTMRTQPASVWALGACAC